MALCGAIQYCYAYLTIKKLTEFVEGDNEKQLLQCFRKVGIARQHSQTFLGV